MNTEERNRIIAEKLNEGLSLGEVQKFLAEEHDVNMTYLDLRLLASELEVDWEKQTPEKTPEDLTPETASLEPEPPADGDGKTHVELSKIARPGAALSGSVTFASGAKAEWYVDNYGRLGLQPEPGSGKPTEDDIKGFQVELQKAVAGGAA